MGDNEGGGKADNGLEDRLAKLEEENRLVFLKKDLPLYCGLWCHSWL